MKIDKNSKYFIISLHALAVILISILFLQILQHFTFFKNYAAGILALAMPFCYGFVVAYLVNPCMMFCERRLLSRIPQCQSALRRGISLLISYIFVILLVTGFFSVVVPQVVNSLYGIFSDIPTYANQAALWVEENLEDYLSQMPLGDQNISTIVDTVTKQTTEMLKTVTQIIPHILQYTVAITTGVKNWLLGFIISVYMLASKEKFAAEVRKTVYAILPKKQGDRTISLFRYINRTFSGFIYAKVVDSFIIGVMCFIGMQILGSVVPSLKSFHEYAMLISVIVGVTNVIPYFGPFIGAIPSILILLIEGLWPAVAFGLFVLALQQFDGNILGPKLLGDSIGLSAFWVIFAVLVMGGIFGAVGMFIGVPLFAIVYTLSKSYLELRLERKGMSTKTVDYYMKEHQMFVHMPSASAEAEKIEAEEIQQERQEEQETTAQEEEGESSDEK